MIKFIGCIMIISSAGYAGFYQADKLVKKLKITKKLYRMACEIVIMLNCSYLTVGEIISRLNSCSEFDELDFIKADPDSLTLRNDIRKKIKNSVCLADFKDEKTIIENFFMELGTTEISGQLALAELFKKELSEQIEKLSEQSAKKCRLYRAMGILGGTFAAVMLI